MNAKNHLLTAPIAGIASGMFFMLLSMNGLAQTADSTADEKKKVIKNKHIRIEVYERPNGVKDTIIEEYVIDGDDAGGDERVIEQKIRIEREEQRAEAMERRSEQMERQAEEIERQAEEIEERAERMAEEIEQRVERQMEDLERQLENLEVDIEKNESILDEDVVIKTHFNRKKVKTVEQSWFVMDLGWNVWLTENTFDLSEDFKEMELDRGRSVNFHLGVIQQGVNLYKGKLRFVYGLGIEYNNYRFKEDIDLLKDSEPLTYVLNTDREYRKNKLVSLHATIPFMLNFKSDAHNDDNAFKLAAGVQLGYLMSSHTKQKWGERGDKEKKKTRGDFGFSDYRYGYVVQFGYGDLNLYAKYYPTPVFKENLGPTANTACVGLVLTPF